MKKALLSLIAAVASGMAYAAPAPYPLPINSQAQTAPPVLVYRASETAFRVRFTDGATASDITGCIPFMAWSTNANATGVSTSSYTIVSATNGMVHFHFDPSAVNYAAGRYLYEVGVRSNAIPRVYRQGIFQIYNSPVGAGVSAVTWSTPVNWLLLDWSNLPTITVNGVTGSIETNLSFTVTGSGGGSVTSVNGQTGTVTITASGLGAITNEVDTLATAAGRGDFAGTETITPLRVGAMMFGSGSGSYASGVNWGAYGKSAGGGASGDTWGAYGYYAGWLASGNGWGAYGYYAGNGASGTGWGAYGYQAGTGASGTGWGAYGVGAGNGASGTGWGAYGYQAGSSAIWTNSHAFGSHAGYQATGNTRLYIDVYSVAPASANGTGDMIYGDNGQLNLGRTGALTNDLPNQLRGRWKGNGSEFTDMTVSQIAGAYPASNPSNFVTQSQVANLASTNYVNALVASNTTVPRAWMPLTTQSQYGYVTLTCASNSVINIGPAPLNSFVIRPLIMQALDGSAYTFSNIVFYCDRSVADPRTSQGFAAITTGVFTISNWGLPSPKGFVMRRKDSMLVPGAFRRNIAAYSLGIAGTSLILMCLWSPATDAELADDDGIIEYANDAR